MPFCVWRFQAGASAGKEVLSEMVSEVFGADVEFQNAKLSPKITTDHNEEKCHRCFTMLYCILRYIVVMFW
jgi:hypothetical protein